KMKLRLATVFVLLIALPTGIVFGAQQQQPPPILQQTPFGVRELPGPPPEPPAAPQPVAPPPQSQPPAPAAAQAAVAATPPAATQAADDLVHISLDLDNTDIYQVIKIIADNLKLNYIIDSAIKGTVNVHTSGNLRRSDLLPLLETLLKINGATM